MSVLTFGNTVSEHDDLVGEFTSSLLKHGVMRFSHGSEISNDLPVHQRYSNNGLLDSLSTFLESDAWHDLVLLAIDRGYGNGDRGRNDTRLGRRVSDIGTDHEGILGEELWHGNLMSHTSKLGVDLHRH